MKTNFKRLVALALTLCILATLMVPVVFAEDEAVESPSANVAETYPIRLADLSQTDHTNLSGWNTSFAGSSGYKTTVDVAGLSKITTSYNAKTLNWRFYATDSSAYQYRKNTMLQPRLDDANSFAALQLRVSEPGAYNLKITMDKSDPAEGAPWTNGQKTWKGNVTAYIIPLSVVNEAVANAVIPEVSEGETALTAEQVAIRSLMTDKYSVGTVSVSSSQTELSFDKVRIDSDEVVVVYTATAENFVLCEMSLNGAAYEKKTVANYDITPFDLTADFSTWASHTYNKVLLKDGALITGSAIKVSNVGSSTNYAALGWKSYSSSIAGYRAYTGYQPYIKAAGDLGAYQIKVPANGDMYLSFTLDRTASYVIGETTVTNNYAKLTGDVTAYLIPLAEVSDIATQTADDTYCVGTKTLLASESTVTFNKAFLTAGEYVVVYKATAGYFYFGEMKLEQLSCDEIVSNEVTNSQTILTGLYDISDPVFDQITNKKTTFADDLGGTTLRAYTDSLYAEGKMDWKVETYSATFTDANFLFNSTNRGGLWISTPNTEAKTDDWAALRFRVKVGDNYNISLNTGRAANGPLTAYLFPATSEAMTAEEIAALMTPANVIYYKEANLVEENQQISAGYLDGEYILVLDCPYIKTREIFLYDITLETDDKLTEADAQYYNFNLFDESNPYYSLVTDRYTTVTEEVTNEETGETTTVTSYQKIEASLTSSGSNFYSMDGVVLARDAEGNPTELGRLYKAVYADDGSGYPKSLNWRPDAVYASTDHTKLSADMKAHEIYDPAQMTTGTVYKSEFTGTTSDFLQFTSFMIRVPKAGTYTLSLDGGAYNYTANVYFIDAHADYSTYVGDTFVKNNITDEAQANLVGAVDVKKNTLCEVGQVTVDAGGDFLVAITTTASNNYDPYLKGIALTPVIETAAAGVGGAAYNTFAEAVEAAEYGDTIHLLDFAIADEVVVPAGVTLNLNGQMLVADSVSAIAPGAMVIDSTDGAGMLMVDEVDFNENNPQLPLYDKANGHYYLFNVEIVPVTVTGKSGTPKYWFQVKFSNKGACDMIDAYTDLRIQADLTWDDMGDAVAVASADAAFSAAWASKYAANDSIYITVTAVDAGEITDFALAPQVAAYGVVISGDAMHKGA